MGMSLKEAVGVNNYNIDLKTGEKLTHSEVYDRIIEFLGGLDAIAPYIPFAIEELREKVKEDPNLNNTRLAVWDKVAEHSAKVLDSLQHHKSIWSLYRRYGISFASTADGVSLLKEAARRLVEREAAKG